MQFDLDELHKTETKLRQHTFTNSIVHFNGKKQHPNPITL